MLSRATLPDEGGVTGWAVVNPVGVAFVLAVVVGMVASPRLTRNESGPRPPQLSPRNFRSDQTRAHHEDHNPLIGAPRDADATVGNRRARRIIGNATPPVIKGMWPSFERT